ncbi:MAG: ectoine hydroxylase [Deltaproteobacteria bacterium]|nr:ectoine hydroxylase [Deltaproteobacteria bacterium]MCB9786638.1 ectoine hydroxylase [Deltaproteobacteria bacterium]
MHATDPYWSRGERSELAQRQDPVCWGDGEGPLDAEQLASFEERGFILQRGLLAPSEVDALLEEARRLSETLDRGREDVIPEPESDALRSIFRIHRHSRAFAALAADPRLAGVARQILGSEVYLHQTRINFKPGFDGRAFHWHSDFETWHMEDGMPRIRALSASVLLTRNAAINGPLMLVSGSHKRYVRCAGATPDDHYKQSLREQRYGVPDKDALRELASGGEIVQATGPPGTVLFFDCNLMHGSAGNLSPMPRHNVFLVFNSVENRLVEPFGGTPPRPDFLGERAPRPITVSVPGRAPADPAVLPAARARP